MTIGELERYAQSYERIQKAKAQEKASYDYRLADLIGYSIARLYSNEAKYPEIYDAYPAIFDKEAIEEARIEEENKKTFEHLKQFADSFKKNK